MAGEAEQLLRLMLRFGSADDESRRKAWGDIMNAVRRMQQCERSALDRADQPAGADWIGWLEMGTPSKEKGSACGVSARARHLERDIEVIPDRIWAMASRIPRLPPHLVDRCKVNKKEARQHAGSIADWKP